MTNMENKFKNICNFYAITHKLKNLLRIGWTPQRWGVFTGKIESVAEHIYGTQMLAFAINSEFSLGFNMEKISLMLAIHELAETIVGDISLIDKKLTKEEKSKLEIDTVSKILEPLKCKDTIKNLFIEFEEGKTKEAIFAKKIDKIEADFQLKFYDETSCCDAKLPEGTYKKIIEDGLAKGHNTISKAIIDFDKRHLDGDQIIEDLVDYLANNKIFHNNHLVE